MGKDNIVFHTIIWPAELLGYGTGGELGAGRELIVPDNVAASEFLNMERQQFSASRGVGILLGDFLDRYDADALRYYLSAGGPRPTTPISPGPSSSAATTTSSSRRGATSSTGR